MNVPASPCIRSMDIPTRKHALIKKSLLSRWACVWVNRIGPLARSRLRRWIWPHPAIYDLVNKVYRPDKIQPTKADIILDGYPRSGNWFAYAALVLSQPAPIVVCHHHHSPSVILEGARLGKPTLLLVREPFTAMVSALVGQPHRTMRELLDFYIDYYSIVRPVSHQVTVATFDQVTQDFGRVTERLNRRHGSHFVEFNHDGDQVEKCFQWLEQAQRAADPNLPARIVAHPSADREPMRQQAKAKLKHAMHTDAGFSEKWTAAERLFWALSDIAIGQEDCSKSYDP